MDNLINAGKEFLESQSGGNQGQGGGFDPSNQQHKGNYPAGGGYSGGDDEEDFRRAHEHANRMSGDSGNSDLFSNAISRISGKQQKLQDEDFDEDDAMRKHQQAYNDTDTADSSSLGVGAALQALKKFNGGATGDSQDKGAFMGLAMSEASKLFDSKQSQGLVADGADKESVVQKAGEMALKMYLKSQGGGSAGGLMSLASKFM